jgi:crotonobetainyl-CoA:carnitine CoA-transferase CaiB-like acyl-CoA transferase
MKSANVPVGYLRTVEEAFNSPEASAIASARSAPGHGLGPNIESPPALIDAVADPVAAPLGEHTKDVLRKHDAHRILAGRGLERYEARPVTALGTARYSCSQVARTAMLGDARR